MTALHEIHFLPLFTGMKHDIFTCRRQALPSVTLDKFEKLHRRPGAVLARSIVRRTVSQSLTRIGLISCLRLRKQMASVSPPIQQV